MSAILKKIRGESVSIGFSFPLSKMPQVEEIQVYVGKVLKAKKSDGTLISTADSNVFLMQLTGSFTSTLLNNNLITVAVRYSDLGIEKTPNGESLNLFIENTDHLFTDDSVSDVAHATVVLTIQDNELVQNITLATIYRGYNATEIFRVNKNMPNATDDDPWHYYFDGRTVKYAIEAENGNIYPNPFSPSLADDGITEIYPFILVTILDGKTLSPRYDVGYEIIDDFKNFKIRTSVIEQIENFVTSSTEYLFLIVERK